MTSAASVTSTFLIPELREDEFELFRAFAYQSAGIALAEGKRALVHGRLSKRLRELRINSFLNYYHYILADHQERQIALDLLTTNETYFFREPKHFDLLSQRILPEVNSRVPRIWSAAASSGQEAYSIAMIMADYYGFQKSWEIVGTDISTRVLETARRALYPIDAARTIPRGLLRQFCLRGKGDYVGQILIERCLRERVQFAHANLTQRLPDSMGEFDIAFLRNVIIYFDMPTKQDVVKRVTAHLRPGGWLLLGHAESLIGDFGPLRQILPTVYQKEG